MRPSLYLPRDAEARAAFRIRVFFLLLSRLSNPATTKHDHHLFLTYALFFFWRSGVFGAIGIKTGGHDPYYLLAFLLFKSVSPGIWDGRTWNYTTGHGKQSKARNYYLSSSFSEERKAKLHLVWIDRTTSTLGIIINASRLPFDQTLSPAGLAMDG